MLGHFVDEETEAEKLSKQIRITQDRVSVACGLEPAATLLQLSHYAKGLQDPPGCPPQSRLRARREWAPVLLTGGKRLFPVPSSQVTPHPHSSPEAHDPSPPVSWRGRDETSRATTGWEGRRERELGRLHQTRKKGFTYTLLDCWAKQQAE